VVGITGDPTDFLLQWKDHPFPPTNDLLRKYLKWQILNKEAA